MLKGLGSLGDMAGMMKKAQEMQGKMAQMQEDLQTIMVEGSSGAGLVKATCTAKGELKGLDIDPSIFNGDDKEVVEDLILAAIKDAQARASEAASAEMAKVTEGMEVVDRIAAQPTGVKSRMRDVPLSPVIIEKVSILSDTPEPAQPQTDPAAQ